MTTSNPQGGWPPQGVPQPTNPAYGPAPYGAPGGAPMTPPPAAPQHGGEPDPWAGRENAILAHQEQAKQGFGRAPSYLDLGKLKEMGIERYRARQSGNYLRILPPREANTYFSRVILVHYEVGPDNAAVLCPAKMLHAPCPICEERARLQQDPEADQKQVGNLRVSNRFLFFVVDLSSAQEAAKGVQIYDAPPKVDKEIGALCKDPMTGQVQDISHPVRGAAVWFNREGDRKNNTVYSGFRLYPNQPPVPRELLARIPSFDDLLAYMSYDDIRMLMGVGTSVAPSGPPPSVGYPAGVPMNMPPTPAAPPSYHTPPATGWPGYAPPATPAAGYPMPYPPEEPVGPPRGSMEEPADVDDAPPMQGPPMAPPMQGPPMAGPAPVAPPPAGPVGGSIQDRINARVRGMGAR